MTGRERWLSSGRRELVELPSEAPADGEARSHRWPIFARLAPSAGPWVSLLHGSPTSSWDFSYLAPLLDGRVSTLALDFLGFGASDKPDIDYSISLQADITAALWARHRVSSTWLVAHDYGALVALELLARSARERLATRILGVSLLNAPLYPGRRAPLGPRLLRVPGLGALLSPFASRASFLKGLQRSYGVSGCPPEDELAQHWKALEERGGRAILRNLMHDERDLDLHRERWTWALEAELCPVSFLWGLADPLDGSIIHELRRRKPGARFVELPGVGHFPHVEDPVSVADAILEVTRAR